MTEAQTGDTVRVHYTGRLDDESIFDSSSGRDPLEFQLGDGQVIAGFDTGVLGMREGEARTIEIPAEQAYGTRKEEMISEVDRERFPAEIEPEIGQRLQLTQGSTTLVVTVVEVAADTVTLDANHPLAGQNLTFDVELVEIV
jgi:peptidylprolyl isomerase